MSPQRSRLAARDAADADDDRFRRVRQERLVIETVDGPVEVDLTESPLRWLASRRDAAGQPFLAAHEVEAGERFRRDVTMAGLLPSLGVAWAAPVSGGGWAETYTEVVLAARQRVDAAIRAVGPDLGALLLDVCGFLKGLEMVERERGWPARTAKVVLKLALAALARSYGLAGAAVGPERGRIRAWSAPPA